MRCDFAKEALFDAGGGDDRDPEYMLAFGSLYSRHFLLNFLPLSVENPRRFGTQGVFEVFVFAQVTEHGISSAPSVEYFFYFWVRISDRRCQTIGVIPRKQLLRTLVRIFHQIR